MRVSARAVIIEDGKILLMFRRKIKDGVVKEYYVVAGGGVEEGETLEQTVKREIKEELSVDIEILEFLGEIQYEDAIGNYFHCKIINGAPKLGGEELDRMSEENYYEPRWVDTKEIDTLDLKTASLIKKLL